jgi:hypothetical protein
LGGGNIISSTEAVNDGIVYQRLPTLVALIGYAVYRMRKKKKQSAIIFYFIPSTLMLISPLIFRG